MNDKTKKILGLIGASVYFLILEGLTFLAGFTVGSKYSPTALTASAAENDIPDAFRDYQEVWYIKKTLDSSAIVLNNQLIYTKDNSYNYTNSMTLPGDVYLYMLSSANVNASTTIIRACDTIYISSSSLEFGAQRIDGPNTIYSFNPNDVNYNNTYFYSSTTGSSRGFRSSLDEYRFVGFDFDSSDVVLSAITGQYHQFRDFLAPFAVRVDVATPTPPPDGSSDFDDGYDYGYNYGYNEGYSQGVLDSIDVVYSTPIDALLHSVDMFLSLEPFGNGFKLGTILMISFGMILLGFAIKIFLGG